MSNELTQEDATKLAIDMQRVIAHLAKNIMGVSMDKAVLMAEGHWPMHEFTVSLSYNAMNALGDILNGMDAVTEEDAWMNPVFERARAACGERERGQ